MLEAPAKLQSSFPEWLHRLWLDLRYAARSLSKKPGFLYNLARAETQLGHDEAALAYLRRYLEEEPGSPDAPSGPRLKSQRGGSWINQARAISGGAGKVA